MLIVDQPAEKDIILATEDLGDFHSQFEIVWVLKTLIILSKMSFHKQHKLKFVTFSAWCTVFEVFIHGN